MYARKFADISGVMRAEAAAVRQKSFKCRWIEFVRPDDYWPHPYSLEQAFEAFRWMMESGRNYRNPGRWGSSGVLELLSTQPTCTGFSLDSRPICSIGDLNTRFHFALLSAGRSSVRVWRAEQRVGVAEERMIAVRHYRPFRGPTPEDEFQDLVKGVLSSFGASRTVKQLNPSWADATEVHRTTLALVRRSCGLRWRLTLRYGVDGSSWDHHVAEQGGWELFWDFVVRASLELRGLVEVEG